MLHFEVELEVAYELSSGLHYISHYLFTLQDFFFYLVCNFYCFTNLFHMAGVIGEYILILAVYLTTYAFQQFSKLVCQ